MEGNRKLVMLLAGLVAILLLGVMTAWGGLPADALGTLSWSVVFLVGTGMGGNALEHFAKQPKPPMVSAPEGS